MKGGKEAGHTDRGAGLQPVPGELWSWNGHSGLSWVWTRRLVLIFPSPLISYGMWLPLGRGMTLGEGLSSAEGKSERGPTVR